MLLNNIDMELAIYLTTPTRVLPCVTLNIVGEIDVLYLLPSDLSNFTT